MGVFPIEIWYPKLCELARSEVNRLVYTYRVPLDREDAEQVAVIHAWRTLRDQWPKSWAFVRIVMRRHLCNFFVREYATKKRGAFVGHVSIMIDINDGGRTDRIEHPEVPGNSPWEEVEDVIAVGQLMDKVFALRPKHRADFVDNIRDQGRDDKRKRTTSRQFDEYRRNAFISKARRLQRRRYDK